MTLTKALRRVTSAFSREPKPRRRPSRRRGMLLESLEDRRLLATYTVENVMGAGPDSLREAIIEANNHPGPDHIDFLPGLAGQTISIQSPLPDITESVTITGPTGPFGFFGSGITIDAQGTTDVRPLTITNAANEVTLSNLTLTGGNATGDVGGGLSNNADDTTLINVTVIDNEADGVGGGIYHGGESLTVTDSAISDNTSGAAGGGAYLGDGHVTFTNSIISNNQAQETGGIHDTDFTSVSVTVIDSTIRDNSAVDGGGGIEGNGSYTIIGSTISGNTTDFLYGGGILAYGSATIRNSTIHGNASDLAGGGAYGFDVLTIDNSTVTANNSGGVGGSSTSTITVNNSIFAETIGGVNVGVAATLGAGNWNGSIDGDPQLGPLQDNGGPTFTRLPLAGSPVIDAGDSQTTILAMLSFDQRGEERFIDGDYDGTDTVDIGAVEFIPEAELHGQKFHDINGDGVRDPGEPGLDGWTIQLFEDIDGEALQQTVTASIDLNDDGVIDPETEQGLYSFVNLDEGDYELVEVLQDGWVQTVAPGPVNVTFNRIEDLDFGNSQFAGIIRGQKFHDLNGNGARDLDEPGLDGWTVQLFDSQIIDPVAEQVTHSVDLNGDGTIDPITEQGLYEFTGVAPGVYSVGEVLQQGWHQTLAPDSVTITTTESFENVDLGNAERLQIVSSPDDTLEVPVPTNSSIHVPVQYNTSDSNPHTTGIGVRMHFNSALLTFNGLNNSAPSPVQSYQILPDTDDLDNDLATDTYVLTAWASRLGLWPNLALPAKLFDSHFSVAGSLSHPVSTTINFTDTSTDVRYDFLGRPITIDLVPASLDVDGNGVADALSDGMLITRYLFGARGDALVNNAVAADATRSDAEDIAGYLDYVRDTMLDVDANGVADALTDAVLIQRYLFGFEDNMLTDNALAPDATRTDAEEIAEFLEQFDPAVEISSELVEDIVAPVVLAEGEGFVGPTSTTGGHQMLTTTPRRGDVSSRSLDFDIAYSTNPPGTSTTGLGTRLHFDSSRLEFDDLTNPADGLIIEQVQDDTNDLDNDPSTDKFLLTGFFDIDGQWPLGSSPNVRLGTAQFVTTNDFVGPTTLNVTSAATASGFELSAPSITIGMPHTNPKNAIDVDGDGHVSPIDSLIVINRLNETGAELLAGVNLDPYSMDVNNDGSLSPVDVLWVINWLIEEDNR